MQKAYVIALGNELGEMIDMPIAELAVELDVSIVSAEEIQLLNKEYREIDKVTDVLSFPQFENVQGLLENLDDEIETLLGDVVICYDVAEKQAEEYGTGISRELVYLFVHSVFHLLGYDHMDEADKKEMRQAEETVMEEIGL
ncbi:MAG: rRNA maturation RNase YbeY [Bacillota bacterium]|nr:rRNA maturation RNase YbeY [Bacillota bacterium]